MPTQTLQENVNYRQSKQFLMFLVYVISIFSKPVVSGDSPVSISGFVPFGALCLQTPRFVPRSLIIQLDLAKVF